MSRGGASGAGGGSDLAGVRHEAPLPPGAADVVDLRLRAVSPLLVLALPGALVFAGLWGVVRSGGGSTAFDGSVAGWFAVHRTAVEGQAGLAAAGVTGPAVLVGVTVLIAAMMWLREHRRDALLLTGSVVIAYAAGAAAKLATHRARPSAPVNLAPETESSFPSGHVLAVTTLVGVLLVLAWGRLSRMGRLLASVAATGIVVAVAVDRLIVGAHWFTDVVASLALAAVVVGAAALVHRSPAPPPG